MWSMGIAPRDRKLTVVATRMVVGIGPIDEPPFPAMARYYPEHDFWAAEDEPKNGLPSLGLIPRNPLGWIC